VAKSWIFSASAMAKLSSCIRGTGEACPLQILHRIAFQADLMVPALFPCCDYPPTCVSFQIFGGQRHVPNSGELQVFRASLHWQSTDHGLVKVFHCLLSIMLRLGSKEIARSSFSLLHDKSLSLHSFGLWKEQNEGHSTCP
jgi:hypothetical protein